MARRVQLHYDELRGIVKKFRDEGEDIAQLQVKTRDRVRDLHKDWEGESSEKFFKEMENDLLPALSRLSKALFFAQDTLQRIIKVIHDHDEDTKKFFNIDSSHAGNVNLGAFAAGRQTQSADFGSMMGVGLETGAGAAPEGAAPGGVPIPFPNVGTSDAPATGQAQGAAAGAGVAAQQAPAGGAAGGGGGGGGSQAGQGLQGGLGSMGGGVGAAVGGSGGSAAGGGAAGGGAQAPDHIFDSSGGGSSAGGGSAQTAQGGGSGGGAAQGASGGEGAAAAGAAGAAGSAAAGGAGKAIKGRRLTKKNK